MILVTGGTGLLGAHLIYDLLKKGEKVRATCRKNSDTGAVERTILYYRSNAAELLTNLEWEEADLLDVTALDAVFKGVEEVYHCAALVSFDSADSKDLLKMNPVMTANIINIALDKGIRKMIYVSSVAALGRKAEAEYINEDSEWVPGKQNSVYARSKYRAELEVWRGIQEGLNAAIVNPCIIIGPGDWEKGSTALFHTIAKGFKYYTLGTNAYVDVRDVVESMIRLMESPVSGQRYVVASENLSYKKFFEYIAESLNVRTPYKEVQPWMSAVLWRLEKVRSFLSGRKAVITKETSETAQRTYYYDNGKIKKELGFEFRPVTQTIADMARHYRKWQKQKKG
ncbi:MAG: NAD-dependent epimerase/dehydratase family protein [Owenweeksia sp.]